MSKSNDQPFDDPSLAGAAPGTAAETTGEDSAPPVDAHPAEPESPVALASLGEAQEASDAAEVAASATDAPAAEEPAKEVYRIGEWSGLPNYGCPHCAYSSLSGDGDIELHILARLELGDVRHLPALTIVRPEEA